MNIGKFPLIVASLIAALFTQPVWPQSTTGNIAGSVTDSSVAPIGGAKVSAINAAFSSVTQARNNFDGTSGRGIMDGPGFKKVDMGIYRDFRIQEQKKLTFRMEMSNAFNIVNLSNPATGSNATATFGRISTANQMRLVQLGLRFTF